MTDIPDPSFTKDLIAAARKRADLKLGAKRRDEHRGELQPLQAAYEKVRTLLDYQEERFIRRLASRRILNRLILLEARREGIGAELVGELVRASYLDPRIVPEDVIARIDDCLTPYLKAIPSVAGAAVATERIKQQRRLLGIAAAQIEDLMRPPYVEAVLVDGLAADIATYLTNPGERQAQQLALATFLNADAELLVWRLEGASGSELWKHFQADPAEVVGRLLAELDRLEELLRSEHFEAQVRRFRRLVPPYRLLTEITDLNPDVIETLLRNDSALDLTLKDIAQQRMARSKERIRRSMLQATLYLFVTKIIIGLGIEVPYDQFVSGHIVVLPLVINVLTPPALMIIASLGIRPPGTENLALLLERTKYLLRGEALPKLPMVAKQSRNGSNVLFWLFFAALYLAVFGGLIWLLAGLGFNTVSILVFLFFVSVVGFFAFRIRANAKELAIISERSPFPFAIVDFLALPLLQVGRRLSHTVRQLNVILFVMDFLIEAPFKLFLRVIEDWFAFLREKREELQ